MAKKNLSKPQPATPQKPPLSEADKKVSVAHTMGSCGEHLEKVAEKIHQMAMMLYDVNDEAPMGESNDIVAGVDRILDGLGTDIAKVGTDLKDLERIANARGYK
jgi:hypothetical protein